MSTAFALLFLGSSALFIWGVISPSSLSKFSKKPLTRRDAGIGFGIFAAVFFVLTGATAPKASVAFKPNDQANVSTLRDSQVKPKTKAATVRVETTAETEPVPFTTTTVNDSTLTKGTTKVTTQGVNGVKTLTYEVTYNDDVQTGKRLIKEEITTPPVAQVVAIGTYVKPAASQPNCDPNYAGACVPNVYPDDVDCAGGSGNGPYYVAGPVHVVGVDHYGLDRDGDHWACE
jgi:hypothetical protein